MERAGMRRRIALWAAAAGGAVALAACGAGRQREPAVSLTVTAPVRLQVWDEAGLNAQPIYDRWLPSFLAAHPQLTVEYTPLPADWGPKLTTSIVAGTPPDATVAYSTPYGSLVLQQQLTPLDRYLRAARFDASDYLGPVWEGMRHQGQTFGLPKHVNTNLLFYNREHFRRAGVPFPTDDWTHAQLLEAAQQLGRGPPDQREVWGVSCNSWANLTSRVCSLLWGQCARLNEPRRPEAFTFTRAENVPAFQWAHDIVWRRHLAPRDDAERGGVTERPAMFHSGALAMCLDGTAALPTATAGTVDWDTVRLPRGPCGRGELAAFGRYVMPRGVKTPEASWAFVAGITDRDAQRVMGETGGVQPARRSQLDAWARGFPGRNLKGAVPTDETRPDVFTRWPKAAEVSAAVAPIMDRLFNKNEVSVADALKQMQDATAAALATGGR